MGPRWGYGRVFCVWPRFKTAHHEAQQALPAGEMEVEGECAEVVNRVRNHLLLGFGEDGTLE